MAIFLLGCDAPLEDTKTMRIAGMNPQIQSVSLEDSPGYICITATDRQLDIDGFYINYYQDEDLYHSFFFPVPPQWAETSRYCDSDDPGQHDNITAFEIIAVDEEGNESEPYTGRI